MSGQTKRATFVLWVITGFFVIFPDHTYPAWEFRKESFEFFYDVLWLGNSDTDSAPSPLLGVFGGGVRFWLSDSFSFQPELGLYGMEYFYRDGKAYPAEIEYKDAVGVIGILIDPLLYYRYPLKGETLVLNGGFGPALSFKIPLVPHGDAPTQEVGDYFLSNARFFYLELRGTLDWTITRALGLSVRLRTLLPIFHLWDGEGAPFYDQLFFGAGLGIRIKG